MSGPLPKQQQSRSPKGKDLEVISKADAVEIVKEINMKNVGESIEAFFSNDETGDEEDGEYSQG